MMIRKRLVFSLATVALLLAACSGTNQTPSPAEPVVQPIVGSDAKLSVSDLQADLDSLYEGLEAAHFDLYARRPKAELDAAFTRVRAGLDAPLTREQAQLRFQRFVAEARVAHARIDLPFERWAQYRSGGGRAVPLFLRVQNDRVYVWDLPVPVAGLAEGDEILRIEQQPARDWLDQLGTLISADTVYMRDAQVERLVPMLIWLTYGDVSGLNVAKASSDANPMTVFIPSRTRAEVEAASKAAPERPSREFKLLPSGVAYLRPGPFYDDRPEAETPWGTTAFRTFIDDAFAQILAAQSRDLIIDLRDNPGGDNSFSDLMLAWIANKPFRFSPGFEIKVSAATVASNQARLDAAPADAGGASAEMAELFRDKQAGEVVLYPIPEVAPQAGRRFTGQVYALINRHTYSNAANVAAVIQDYQFGRILGEETSDLASTLGAMEQFTLPRTGLVVGYPKARILRPNGDPTPRGVVPDVTLPTPLAEGEQDAVLEAALQWLTEQSR